VIWRREQHHSCARIISVCSPFAVRSRARNSSQAPERATGTRGDGRASTDCVPRSICSRSRCRCSAPFTTMSIARPQSFTSSPITALSRRLGDRLPASRQGTYAVRRPAAQIARHAQASNRSFSKAGPETQRRLSHPVQLCGQWLRGSALSPPPQSGIRSSSSKSWACDSGSPYLISVDISRPEARVDLLFGCALTPTARAPPYFWASRRTVFRPPIGAAFQLGCPRFVGISPTLYLVSVLFKHNQRLRQVPPINGFQLIMTPIDVPETCADSHPKVYLRGSDWRLVSAIVASAVKSGCCPQSH
jgi:hypothetical protein